MVGNYVSGLICCVVAGVAFGSNYLPVKQVSVRDGVFFSACMAIGILLVGAIVNFTIADDDYAILPLHRPPRFEPKAAVGGALWMLGNFLCPFVIERLGIGLGLAVWDCSNLMFGWATGEFGMFGVWHETTAAPVLNYTGVVMACLSLVLLAFATDDGDTTKEAAASNTQALEATEEPEGAKKGCDLMRAGTLSTMCSSDWDEADLEDGGMEDAGPPPPTQPIQVKSSGLKHLATCSTDSTVCSSTEEGVLASHQCSHQEQQTASKSSAITSTAEFLEGSEVPKVGSLTSLMLRIGSWLPGSFAQGFILALVAGVLFSQTFTWPTDLMQQGKLGEAHSTNPMDYVFSHFCGIGATGLVVLLSYVAVRRGEAYTPRNIILPAMASGAMWAVGQVAWFQANVELSLVIAFPIISTLPGIISMFWGCLLFGELRSQRARRLALAGMCIRLPAVALIGLSGVL
mmetsp:Transcript_64655/g.166381  ORF Transcript_64655/g.166381 Transcript_64655/m.166381 type:complete len:459 (-) Transcript_64655:392-1768(-)